MKHIVTIFLLTCLLSGLAATQIIGTWHGILDAPGMKLRLVIHVQEDAKDGISASLDSPDQGAFGIAADHASFENGILKLTFDALMANIEVKLENEKLTGDFVQMGAQLALELTQEALEAPVLSRPQEPVEPFPYIVQEVKIPHPAAGITLAGTLTLPSKTGIFPGVVLVSGSGPQNRDEELLGHKPFLVIADHLTRNGIAVLRYDDRGVAESEGDHSAADTFDFAQDAISAVRWLNEHPQIAKIGIIGHSEGGLIAPIAANLCPQVSYIVMLAGPGVRGDEVLMGQVEAIMQASGVPEEIISVNTAFNRSVYDIILEIEDETELKGALDALIDAAWESSSQEELFDNLGLSEMKTLLQNQLFNPWMLNFIRTDPHNYLSQLQIPVLALFGEKDLQVLSTQNLNAVKSALDKAGNKQYKLKEYANLNHLFQHCETGNPNEYGSIEETFSQQVLQDIAKWINEIAK